MRAISFNIHPRRWLATKAMGRWWPAVYWSRLSGLRLREVPPPALPGPEWVRLRTLLGGVCGTDLAAVTLRNHPASFLRNLSNWPMWLGHENVAVVDETGPQVAGWGKGDRVTVDPALSCVPRGVTPLCGPCAEGRPALCENTAAGPLPPGTMIGYNNFTGGSWGEYFVAHQSQLHRVPAAIPDRMAVLTDPVACALHAALRHRPADDERVLVLGGGLLGMGVIAALRAIGCRAHVTALVRHDHQAELARAFCADATLVSPRGQSHADRYDDIARLVGGRRVPGQFGNQMLIGGYDAAYDCVGTGRSLTDAMKFTRARGTVVALGTSQICVVDTTPLWFGELNVIGCSGRQIERFEGRSLHTYDVLFELIGQGRVSLERIPTETFPLGRFREAFAALVGPRRRPICRAVFCFA